MRQQNDGCHHNGPRRAHKQRFHPIQQHADGAGDAHKQASQVFSQPLKAVIQHAFELASQNGAGGKVMQPWHPVREDEAQDGQDPCENHKGRHQPQRWPDDAFRHGRIGPPSLKAGFHGRIGPEPLQTLGDRKDGKPGQQQGRAPSGQLFGFHQCLGGCVFQRFGRTFQSSCVVGPGCGGFVSLGPSVNRTVAQSGRADKFRLAQFAEQTLEYLHDRNGFNDQKNPEL